MELYLVALFKWTLFDPEERLLAQGKAGIHTSCRSESSNYSLVVLDNQWQSLLGPLPTSPNCPLQPGIVENRRGLSTAISCWKHQFSSDHWSLATLSHVSTWMGDHLGIHGVVDILDLSEDCHQSCRKLTKSRSKLLLCFTFGWSEMSWDGSLSLDTDARLSRVQPSRLADTRRAPIELRWENDDSSRKVP